MEKLRREIPLPRLNPPVSDADLEYTRDPRDIKINTIEEISWVLENTDVPPLEARDLRVLLAAGADVFVAASRSGSSVGSLRRAKLRARSVILHYCRDLFRQEEFVRRCRPLDTRRPQPGQPLRLLPAFSTVRPVGLTEAPDGN